MFADDLRLLGKVDERQQAPKPQRVRAEILHRRRPEELEPEECVRVVGEEVDPVDADVGEDLFVAREDEERAELRVVHVHVRDDRGSRCDPDTQTRSKACEAVGEL